jgi:inosine-uridine nucleoside N-ribohydrolase
MQVKISSIAAVLLLAGHWTVRAAEQLAHRVPPVNVIFDTDIWSGTDDAMALAMLHALEDRGEIKILAVTISTNNRWCASYVDLVDTFYGRPQVPIGINHEGMDVEWFRRTFPTFTWPVTRYTEILSERKNKDGTWVYPHRLIDGTKAPEAVALLRKTLASQPDGSVIIIQTGYSTNLARLLGSPSDALSGLKGSELVARKVRLLSMMGGRFGDSKSDGVKESPEFNLLIDVPSAQKVFLEWPTPIVVSGVEVAVRVPSTYLLRDFSYALNNPIAETQRTQCEEQNLVDCGQEPIALPDPTAVLYAVRPDRDYFSLSEPGRITVRDDGESRFEGVPGGQHRYLILHQEQKARIAEAMEMLISQPPRGGK